MNHPVTLCRGTHPAPQALPAGATPVYRRLAAASAAMAAVAAALAIAGCASGPPAPDWQLQAQGALQRAVQARLSGQDRVADAETARARQALAATGRPELLARAELLLCTPQVAQLRFEPCAGYQAQQADAAPAEQAYAAYLAGRLAAAQHRLLPAAQQALVAKAAAAETEAVAALQATADPLSRLVGAALWLQAGRAHPAVVALCVETASAQGWRRPLLAWLQVQRLQAEQAGRRDEAARIQRRIDLVLQPPG